MNSVNESSTVIVETGQLSKCVAGPEGELTILDGINLHIEDGESLAVLGASGSGKSTLLGLLAGLDLPSRGSVRLFGHDLNAMNEDQRALLRGGRVGFVFQSFQLLPGLTALENAMLPLELAGQADAMPAAAHLLNEVGLQKRIHHYPAQLSGGEQQRVAIARAFVHSPQIVFADEPTGNLDQATGRRIIDLIFELQQRRQMTLVLVTHDAALASRCSRRVFLNAGRIDNRESA